MDANTLYYGDNLKILRDNIATESADLIYLDPPFNSNRNYNVLFKDKHHPDQEHAQIQAFDDTWTWTQEADKLYFELVASGVAPPKVADALQAMHNLLGENDLLAYLVMMAARLVELRRVLTPNGSIYLHCDPTASHYLKVLMDAVFDARHFINEVAWKRASAHSDVVQGAKHYGRIHDVLLFYSKSETRTWNTAYMPYDQEYVESTFRYSEPDGRRYQTQPLHAAKPGGDTLYEWKGKLPPPGRYWAFSKENMEQLDKEGRIAYSKNGVARYKIFLDESPGVPAQDLWLDIAPVHYRPKERLGFPTQKPVELLERIISVSSNRGDTILDPFCGCGTAVVAAQGLGRRWIGVDIAYIAVDLMAKRLVDMFGSQVAFEIHGSPRDVGGAAALFAESHFEFERWAVSLVWGQPKERPGGDQGIDGLIRFPMSAKNETGKVIVSVKGGATVNPSFVRDLVGTVKREKAEMGVLICLAKPTRGMVTEAQHSGSYTWPVSGEEYPTIQVITIEDLLNGERVKMPTPLMPYIQAQRHVPESDQARLSI